ncbi:MAG: ketol-acid reductoisomerase [Planctomycetota bacterium]
MSGESESLTARASLDHLADRVVAVLGFGAQGQAHALNLRDSGCQVVVGQRPGGRGYQAALESGFAPLDVAEATRRADLIIFGLPDEAAPAVYTEQIKPALRAGQALGFIHGFAIHYEQIRPPPDVDVILVAPKGQGRAVRSEYLAGRGVAALVAVHQDATGRGLDMALGWAAALRCHRAGLIQTTVKDETETDLFGEQAVLCGGLTALIKAGFETLVEAGYPTELAFLECCHEVKLVVDLVYEGGITAMREKISNTARFGDLTRGPRIIGPATREVMRQILAEIQSGQFAREWIAETRAGLPLFRELTERDRVHELERTGNKVRQMMWGARKEQPKDEDQT